jgi:hypothetical protein
MFQKHPFAFQTLPGYFFEEPVFEACALLASARFLAACLFSVRASLRSFLSPFPIVNVLIEEGLIKEKAEPGFTAAAEFAKELVARKSPAPATNNINDFFIF